MKQKLLLSTLLIAITLAMNAQKRVDANVSYKLGKVSAVVSNIVGWAYDDSKGKWSGYRNVIYAEYKNGNNKTPISMSPSDMCGPDCILSMQFKSIKINGEQYYALYLPHYQGYYDYPHICRGWHTYKEYVVLFFKEESYNAFFNLTEGTVQKIEYYDKEEYGNSSECFYKSEASMLQSYINKDYHYDGNLYVKKEDENTIRFQYPNCFCDQSEIDNGTKKITLHNSSAKVSNFSKSYFEMKVSAWNMLKIK